MHHSQPVNGAILRCLGGCHASQTSRKMCTASGRKNAPTVIALGLQARPGLSSSL